MLVPGGAKAGRISKPYGFTGKLNLQLIPEAAKHIEINHPLFINMDGQRVPFFVMEFDQVSSDSAIVKFEFVDNAEDARALTGCEVFLESLQTLYMQEGSLDLKVVIGYQACDQELGTLGKVTGYIQHDLNPVFLIDYNGHELIVPAVENFIRQIDHKQQTIYFILPDGLTSL